MKHRASLVLAGLAGLVLATPAGASWSASASSGSKSYSKAGSLTQTTGLAAGTTACNGTKKMDIALTWTATPNAKSYTVTWTGTGGGSIVADGTDTTPTTNSATISVKSAATGGSYSITVTAVAGLWKGAASASVGPIATRAC